MARRSKSFQLYRKYIPLNQKCACRPTLPKSSIFRFVKRHLTETESHYRPCGMFLQEAWFARNRFTDDHFSLNHTKSDITSLGLKSIRNVDLRLQVLSHMVV